MLAIAVDKNPFIKALFFIADLTPAISSAKVLARVEKEARSDAIAVLLPVAIRDIFLLTFWFERVNAVSTLYTALLMPIFAIFYLKVKNDIFKRHFSASKNKRQKSTFVYCLI
jgi:hypothetical protein